MRTITMNEANKTFSTPSGVDEAQTKQARESFKVLLADRIIALRSHVFASPEDEAERIGPAREIDILKLVSSVDVKDARHMNLTNITAQGDFSNLDCSHADLAFSDFRSAYMRAARVNIRNRGNLFLTRFPEGVIFEYTPKKSEVPLVIPGLFADPKTGYPTYDPKGKHAAEIMEIVGPQVARAMTQGIAVVGYKDYVPLPKDNPLLVRINAQRAKQTVGEPSVPTF